MKIPRIQLLGSIILFFTLLQCQEEINPLASNPKFYPNDPFQETMAPSQTFEIDAKEDNVMEGQYGTIIVMPKGCFKNAKGETVTDHVKVELAEALSIEQMLLSNLTTTTSGALLETDGMVYLNFTADGEQLTISKENPIHIEIPTKNRKAGMMAYKGIRDTSGSMDWINPKEIEKFLLTIDMSLLNFYPEGFEAKVLEGLPFRNNNTATKELLDSLYYSLSISNGKELNEGFVGTNFNEAYYNPNRAVIRKKYTNDSYTLSDGIDTVTTKVIIPKEQCGIDPGIIKTIRSAPFQNTLISTREFEARLKVIFETCRKDILEIYVKNLNKNLWELDSMAASKLEGNYRQRAFHKFYKQGLTNVKDADQRVELLKGYYEKRLAEIKAQLNAAQKKALSELKEKNEVAQKVADDYKSLLKQRERYRMETYGFNWTETGYINIDRGTTPKDWGPQSLEITVDEGQNYDRVYTYVVYTSIKSLYRLNSSNQVLFYVGNPQTKEMLMPKQGLAIAISIGHKNETPFIGIKEFLIDSESKLSLTLESSSIKEIERLIKAYDQYGEDNNIHKDLSYMALFAQEKKRQKKLIQEQQFILSLWNIAFVCCSDSVDGELLFKANCSSCHKIDRKMIGPRLEQTTSKYSMDWLIAWTRDSQSLMDSGDKDAIAIFEEYNGSMQPSFDLTDEEIKAIYKYVDDSSRNAD